MARRFLTAIDLLKNELQNARVQNLAIAPADPLPGQIYFDTETGAFRFFDGANWVDLMSQEGTITSIGTTAPLQDTGGTSPTISILNATQTDAGAMSAADKTKLDGVDAGATANATDAELRDRSTHTGTQAQSTITNLVDDLAGKVNTADVGVAGGVAGLDGNGLVPTTQLPPLAITTPTVVANIAERDALAAQEGDVAIVTGDATYIFDGTTWLQMSSPEDGVQSVTATAPITSSGGVNPDIGLAQAGVDTEHLTDESVTLSKLAPEVTDQLGTTKATATIGDGAATQYDVAHNFGTQDVMVSLFQNSGAFAEVMADIERIDVNTVRVRFATPPAVDAYRVVVVG